VDPTNDQTELTGAGRGPLGILAAAGPLPIRLAEAGTRQGRPVHIVAITGFAGDEVALFPHERVSIGEVGRMIASFRRAGVREIVIAGAMQRPNLVGLRIDWGFVQNLPTVLALTRGGDDSVLRRVVRFFEGHGFKVVGASDVAPDLLAPDGPMTQRLASDENAKAIARAAGLMADLGHFDIGQGVVARSDAIVAVEGLGGTDAMLRDLGPGGLAEGRARGGVLVKLAKSGQEMRIDLPTIGPETVRGAAAAGLAGIAVGTGAAIVLDRELMAEAADSAGLFVSGLGADADIADGAIHPEDRAPLGHDAITTSSMLHLIARRAPTPGQRRDILLGRQVLYVMRRHGASHAAIVSRAHVLAVSVGLPLPDFVTAQGRTRTWGRRLLGRRRGILVIDGAACAGKAENVLDRVLFSAAKTVSLAGIVVLAPLTADKERRTDIVAWANEAGVVLMCRADEP
jgi:DUF1009 family protein